MINVLSCSVCLNLPGQLYITHTEKKIIKRDVNRVKNLHEKKHTLIPLNLSVSVMCCTLMNSDMSAMSSIDASHVWSLVTSDVQLNNLGVISFENMLDFGNSSVLGLFLLNP